MFNRRDRFPGIFLTALVPLLIFPDAALFAQDAGRPPINASGGWLKQQLKTFRTYPHLDRAYRLMDESRWPEARKELEHCLAGAPRDQQVLMAYLMVLSRMKDFEPLIEYSTVVLKDQPGSVPALRYRALAYYYLDLYNQAVVDFQSIAGNADATADDRKYALAMVTDIAFQQEDFETAYASVQALLREKDDAAARLRLGIVLAGMGEREEAQKAYTESLRLAQSPEEELPALRALADLYRQDQNWAQSSRALQSALKISPDDRGLLLSLADVAQIQGNYPEVARLLRQALKISPDAHTREWLANTLYAMNDFAAAEEEYSRVFPDVSEDADLFRLYMARGYARLKFKKFLDAAADFGRAGEINPSREALLARAQALSSAGRADEAAAAFETTLERYPEATTQLQLGMLLAGLGRNTKAEAYLQAAAQGPIEPQAVFTAKKQLGYIYYNEGRYEEARTAVLDALELEGGRDDTLLTFLGEIAMKTKDYPDAIGYFKQSLEVKENLAGWRNLAEAHASNGDWEEATRINQYLLNLKIPSKLKGEIAGQQSVINIQMGQYDEAAKSLREAIVFGQDQWSNCQAMGISFYSVGAWDQALQQFLRAYKIRPTALLSLYIARSYVHLGKPGIAIHYMRQAVPKAEDLFLSERVALFRELGYLLAGEFQYRLAAEAWETAQELEYDVQIAIRLAGMKRLAGEADAAEAILNDVPQESLTPALKAAWFDELAVIYFEQKRAQDAADMLLKANTLDPTADRQYRLGLAARELGQPKRAVEYLKAACALDPDNDLFAEALGYAWLDLGQLDETAKIFSRLIIHNPDQLSLYDDLAGVYSRQKKYAAAGKLLVEANNRQPSAERHYLMGLNNQARGQTKAAVLNFEAAVQQDPLHIGYAQALGYAYFANKQSGEGERIFQSLIDRYPQELKFYDQLAELLARNRQFEQAINVLLKAEAREPSTDRQYMLGLYLLERGQVDEAVTYFKFLFERDPLNSRFGEALCYAYLRGGRDDEAAEIFESLIQSDPGRLSYYQELAYIDLRRGRNNAALAWFRQAIDAAYLYPVEGPKPGPAADSSSSAVPDNVKGAAGEAGQRAQELYRIREEISRLNNHWDFSIYQMYRDKYNGYSNGSADGSGGIIPSQGGVELVYQPPGIGLRDEKILRLVTRVLWNTRPRSLAIEEDSLQGSAGLQYKPLKYHNLFLSGEGLFKIGDGSSNNWLLRALYSWSRGTGIEAGRPHWNYRSFFGDIGVFLNDPTTTAFYGEVRQGISFNIRNAWIITPHLVVDGRWQDPDPGDGSYSEGGGGLSLKYLFGQTRYETARFSSELLVQYKFGFDTSSSGWVFVNVTRF